MFGKRVFTSILSYFGRTIVPEGYITNYSPVLGKTLSNIAYPVCNKQGIENYKKDVKSYNDLHRSDIAINLNVENIEDDFMKIEYSSSTKGLKETEPRADDGFVMITNSSASQVISEEKNAGVNVK